MVRPTILPGEMRDVKKKKATRVSISLLETDGLKFPHHMRVLLCLLGHVESVSL